MDILFHGVFQTARHVEHTPLDSAHINTLHLIKMQVYLAASLIFLLFGLPGNILTIMALRKASMNDHFYSTHITAMCVFNCLTLLWCVPRYIVQSFHDRDVLSRDPMFCAMYRMVSFSLISMNSWHLVSITATRLLLVVDKNRKWVAFYGEPSRMILLTVAISLLYEIPGTVFWVQFADYTGHYSECYFPSGTAMSIIQIIFICVMPVTLLLVINGWIIYHNRKVPLEPLEADALLVRKNLMKLLKIATCLFLVTLLPAAIYLPLKEKIFNTSNELQFTKSEFVSGMLLIFLYSNNGLNFAIYCCFEKSFRTEFFSVIKCTNSAGKMEEKNVTSALTPSQAKPAILAPPPSARKDDGPKAALNQVDASGNKKSTLPVATKQMSDVKNLTKI